MCDYLKDPSLKVEYEKARMKLRELALKAVATVDPEKEIEIKGHMLDLWIFIEDCLKY